MNEDTSRNMKGWPYFSNFGILAFQRAKGSIMVKERWFSVSYIHPLTTALKNQHLALLVTIYTYSFLPGKIQHLYI